MGMNKMVVGEIQEEETLLTRSFSFSSSSLSSSSSLMVINEDGINETKKKTTTTMPLLALNHVSFVCKSLIKSVEFYEQVLGFVLIKRPSSFDFQGAWLFNHGIGIHLLEADNIPGGGKIKGKKRINPKDNHISFQCTNMELIMQKLKEMKIEYVTAVVKEGGITVDQLFFHDPDGYMIEICNCQNLPLLPLLPSSSSSSSSCPLIKKMPLPIDHSSSSYGKATVKMQCCAEVEALMMERLAIEMMNICF